MKLNLLMIKGDIISISVPDPHNELIFGPHNKIYGCSECFDKNIYNFLSWGL